MVVQFLRQAAADPDVVAIKQTLYRTSQRLADRRARCRGGRGRQVGHRAGRAQGALRRGGQHPLGARPRARRRAGGLRLHRTEDPRQAVAGRAPRRPASSRSYVHIGTGNYHPVTARIYTDLSLLHRRPGDRPRRRPRLQLHHRLFRAGRARAAGDLAASCCAAASSS